MYLLAIIERLKGFATSSPEFNLKSDDVINFIQHEIVWMLQKAILAGEYYIAEEYGSCNSKITEIKTLLDQMSISVGASRVISSTEDDKSSSDWKSNIDPVLFTKIVRTTSNRYLALYKDLINTVDRNLDSLSKGKQGKIVDVKILQGFNMLYDFLEVAQIGKSNIIESDTESIQNYYIFQITLLLTYIDEYLECKLSTVETLENIAKFLNDEIKSNSFSIEVIPILISKAEFLKYKINYRYCHVNHDKESLGLAFDKLGPENAYEEFAIKIDFHYRDFDGNSVRDLEKLIESYKTTPIEKIRLEPFHHLNRYFNKLSIQSYASRKQKIDRLIKVLEEKNSSIESLTLYNKIAFTSALKLLHNSSLRLALNIQIENQFSEIVTNFKDYFGGKTTSPSSPKLEELVELVNSLVDKGGYPDYYCLWLLLRFFIELVEFMIKNPTLLIDEKIIKNDDINKQIISDKILSLKSNLEQQYNQTWGLLSSLFQQMITHESKPIYMFKEECEVNYKLEEKSETIKLFLDSSYILPNDFKRFRRKIDNSKALLVSQLNHLKDALILAMNQLIIEKTIEKADKKAKESEFRAVQIVALFVSIATFVLINVKIFDGKSGLESFGIMLGLAACLFMFNLFFHFMILVRNRGDKKLKSVFIEIWWLLVLPIVFTSISLVLLVLKDNMHENDLKTINHNIDSLFIYRFGKGKIDSVEVRPDTSKKGTGVSKSKKLYTNTTQR